MSNALAYFNEFCMLSSAFCVAMGWRQIRRHQVAIHRRFMLTAAVLAVLFFVSYAVKSVVVGDTMFGGPKALATAYMVFLQVHVVLATGAAVLGVLTLRYALRSAFARHRKIAPWTATAWFVAAGTGLAVFLLLYVVFPPGPTQHFFV